MTLVRLQILDWLCHWDPTSKTFDVATCLSRQRRGVRGPLKLDLMKIIEEDIDGEVHISEVGTSKGISSTHLQMLINGGWAFHSWNQWRMVFHSHQGDG